MKTLTKGLALTVCLMVTFSCFSYKVNISLKNPDVLNGQTLKKVSFRTSCKASANFDLFWTTHHNEKSVKNFDPHKNNATIDFGIFKCNPYFWFAHSAEVKITDNHNKTHSCGKVLDGYHKMALNHNSCEISLLKKNSTLSCSAHCH